MRPHRRCFFLMQKMGSNWFLIISGIIAGLAVTSALLGYLG
jgi:hypothetical protein